MNTMSSRLIVLAAIFLLASAYLASATQTEPVLIREPLSLFPTSVGQWTGRDVLLDEKVLKVLGVSDYLSRYYSAGRTDIGLYIGYHDSQRQGSTIHSPLNCLPGAGWNPVSRTYLNIPVGGQEIQVNRITIQKALDKQVVLYWYQAHGRVVASEYWGKVYTVVDAMRINRTDAAMIRVVVPAPGFDPDSERVAEQTAVAFVQTIYPLLSRHLPE
jgi:EpsI family protein